MGYIDQIPEGILVFEIKKEFGVSDFIMKNVMKGLHDCYLMVNLQNGVWAFQKNALAKGK